MRRAPRAGPAGYARTRRSSRTSATAAMATIGTATIASTRRTVRILAGLVAHGHGASTRVFFRPRLVRLVARGYEANRHAGSGAQTASGPAAEPDRSVRRDGAGAARQRGPPRAPRPRRCRALDP